MSYENIKTEIDGSAFIITINRPDKKNALSISTMDEIYDATKKANQNNIIRGIILTGGQKFFSSGADLNEALQIKSITDGDKFFGVANRLCSFFESIDKPVIAAIEGFCITGGLEIALSCDIRIGSTNSSYAITSARIGTVAGFGGTQRLPRLVGTSNALDILFSANPIDSENAYRIGLITKLVSDGETLSAAKKLVEVYQKRGPISISFAKKAVYKGIEMDLNSAIAYEYSLVTGIYGTDDKKEGISAFLDKRDAIFTGK